jgi:hypothetical protein
MVYISYCLAGYNRTSFCSSFDRHLACCLTMEEVDKLKDPKWKFKWGMPENEVPLSKWVGTGELISKVTKCLFILFDVLHKFKTARLHTIFW